MRPRRRGDARQQPTAINLGFCANVDREEHQQHECRNDTHGAAHGGEQVATRLLELLDDASLDLLARRRHRGGRSRRATSPAGGCRRQLGRRDLHWRGHDHGSAAIGGGDRGHGGRGRRLGRLFDDAAPDAAALGIHPRLQFRECSRKLRLQFLPRLDECWRRQGETAADDPKRTEHQNG